MDQGTEKWLLTFRWMLWLAPAGLRGGLKLEAYHQSRQPQSFFLCGPRCSGTSDRCSGRCGVIFLRAVAAAVSSSTSLRRLRLGVAAQASGTSLSDVSAIPDVAASRITRRRATAKSTLFTCRGAAAKSTPLPRTGAAARSTPLTRRGAAAISTPLTRRGAAARSTPLSDQTSPACHGQIAGITFQLLPCKRWEGCRVHTLTWHAAMFFNSLAVSVAIRGVSH